METVISILAELTSWFMVGVGIIWVVIKLTSWEEDKRKGGVAENEMSFPLRVAPVFIKID
ncbi:MAG: hypothetical protein M1150_01095 [Patescibacteria group bacterium]|nr:hypothetical protein [Patescibacteria group bacterium]